MDFKAASGATIGRVLIFKAAGVTNDVSLFKAAGFSRKHPMVDGGQK